MFASHACVQVRQRCPNLLLQANKHTHQLSNRPESALA